LNPSCSRVEHAHPGVGGFTSALRVFIIEELERLIRERAKNRER